MVSAQTRSTLSQERHESVARIDFEFARNDAFDASTHFQPTKPVLARISLVLYWVAGVAAQDL